MAVAAVVGAIVIAAGGYLGYLAYSNHQSAEDWRDRALASEERLREADVLVAARTKALNRQTRRLNAAAARLERARADLLRSEDDVTALEQRQRELAAEKASLEDDQAYLSGQTTALASVASSLVTCNSELQAVIGALTGGYDASFAAEEAIAACQSAQQISAAYFAQYE
jgi:chromosome segregation ATPase